MSEPCSMTSEIEHIKTDIVDIKVTAKEQAVAMANMRDSHIETKMYINQIRESQTQMSRDTRDYQVLMAKDTKDNQQIASDQAKAIAKKNEETQAAMMASIQQIKDEPANAWKQMKIQWKIFMGGLIISYVWGCVMYAIKTLK